MENLNEQVKFLHEMEAKEIIEESKSKAEKITEEAMERAEEIRKQKMEEKSRYIENEGQQDLARAKTDSRNKVSNERFQLFEETMAEFEENLKKNVEKEDRYRPSLIRLIIEAATKLTGSELEIVVNLRDKEFVCKNLSQLTDRLSYLKNQQIKLRVSKDTLKVLGGTVVRTQDQRQIFNNTLEARIDKFRKESGQKIYEMLFEGADD